jgi:formiminoglutamase
MEWVRTLSRSAALDLVRCRDGEAKLAQTVDLCGDAEPWEAALRRSSAGTVVLGVPSDVGVRANFGRPGCAALWSAARTQLLSMQDNGSLRGESLLVLGEIVADDLMREAAALDPDRAADLRSLRALVSRVDERVARVAADILAAGKRLVAVGGGHENAYGLLKALSLDSRRAVSCINIDAHADLRGDEGRHSGNAFSTAWREGLLGRYIVLGLQEPFVNDEMWRLLEEERGLRAVTLESLRQRSTSASKPRREGSRAWPHAPHLAACEQAVAFVKKRPLALEMDLDAITGVPASAATPAGLSPEEAREMLCFLAARRAVRTFHVCEGSPGDGDSRGVGKLAALMIADVVKASMARGR